MNWHIGQRIVAVKDHSAGIIKKGDIFTIKGLRESPCKCKHIQMDVGIQGRQDSTCTCSTCGKTYNGGMIWYICHTLFAPLDDLSNHTADSLMEEMDREVRVTQTV